MEKPPKTEHARIKKSLIEVFLIFVAIRLAPDVISVNPAMIYFTVSGKKDIDEIHSDITVKQIIYMERLDIDFTALNMGFELPRIYFLSVLLLMSGFNTNLFIMPVIIGGTYTNIRTRFTGISEPRQ